MPFTMEMSRYTALVALAGCVIAASEKVYLEERFSDENYKSRWQQSSWKKDEDSAGDWQLAKGEWYGDEHADLGIQTPTDARFYTLWTELDEEVVNKDKDLVLQFSVKHTQDLDCGGGYLKLLPTSSKDQMPDFSGETPYSIMHGPDVCGFNKKVHSIITDKKGENLEMKATVTPKSDRLTHVYTFIIHPNNTYQVLIDNKQERNGSLYEDYEFLLPRTIKDPDAKKPEDWVDAANIPDPTSTKPEDWVDEATIVDPEATQPDDWNTEEDGEWEPPQIANPAYQGAWRQKTMPNPDYKGVWERPEIPNPDFEEDPEVYLLPPLKFAGFEIWQVKAGTIFDNILVTDDVAYARQFAEETWGASKDAEKAMYDEYAAEEERIRKEEADKAAEAAKAAAGDSGEDADEGEDEDEEGTVETKKSEAVDDEDEQDADEMHAEL